VSEPTIKEERRLFSMALPAEVRMTIEADDHAEASELFRAMVGQAWVKAMLDMGWAQPRTGLEVAVRLA